MYLVMASTPQVLALGLLLRWIVMAGGTEWNSDPLRVLGGRIDTWLCPLLCGCFL